MIEKDPTPQSSQTGGQAARSVKSCLVFLLRAALILVVVVLLGITLYLGLPAIFRNAVQPLEGDISALNEAQDEQERINQQVTQRLVDIQKRLQALELQSDGFMQSVDEILRGHSDIQDRVSALQTEQASASAREESASTSMKELSNALDTLERKLGDLEAALVQVKNDFKSLTDQKNDRTGPVAVLQHELQLLKAMEYLTRSRLFLSQNNLGLAEQDILAGRDLLAELVNQVPAHQKNTLRAIIARLEIASNNLPDRPNLAADDLEIAWQMLQAGLPVEATSKPGLTQPASTLTPPGTAVPALQATITATP